VEAAYTNIPPSHLHSHRPHAQFPTVPPLSTSRSDAHEIPHLQARGTACEGPDKRQPPTLHRNHPHFLNVVRTRHDVHSNATPLPQNGMGWAIARGCYCSMCRYSLLDIALVGTPLQDGGKGRETGSGSVRSGHQAGPWCSTQQCRTAASWTRESGDDHESRRVASCASWMRKVGNHGSDNNRI
jgi:hypothetical protein